MPATVRGASFGRRVGVTLLTGLPGVLALVGYVYLTTPAAAVPACRCPSSPSSPGSTP